ncbi:conserved hypothetical protein [Hyella patelloides LEGE 07179]|uniref:DOMON-like domain-containing protein n=1 Tax=Hyella patelloides LEGE 07179 TaxID=945734 RepID=A0A563VK38_9CYAN|nr:DOMON-like domain-containing protein [Hyella patelloides]VEP11645.1 conserved hypothetical protein [Hyella patelloides LEGE 07179]
MSDRIIYLKPFLANKSIPNIEIITTISRSNQQLKINYLLQGDLSQIILPAANNRVNRQDNLWQTTCFEFFLAIFNSPQYWEFNLAPTGNWNMYRFSKYRRGMRVEKAFENLPFQVMTSNSTYQMETQISLKPIIAGNTPLELAVTTVIEDTNHNLSYWAITHPGTQADFHRRDSFISI